jgi:hypothetical protein
VTVMLAAAISFLAAFLVARHLGRFLPADDARHDDIHVTDAKGYAAVKEAERITRKAAR